MSEFHSLKMVDFMTTLPDGETDGQLVRGVQLSCERRGTLADLPEESSRRRRADQALPSIWKRTRARMTGAQSAT